MDKIVVWGFRWCATLPKGLCAICGCAGRWRRPALPMKPG